MLAANRALRFPTSKVGSVSPAATALLCSALHRTAPHRCCKVSTPNKDPGKDGTVRKRPWITEYSTAEFSKPLSRHTDVRLTPPAPNSQCTQSLLRRYHPREAHNPIASGLRGWRSSRPGQRWGEA
ncbi:uncharacterized protein Triagg1_4732 [Trichoderma aggressivum f. europaeum]|uniref:Uncharacterized protein n=1 Tax=Trichoderma aggressivum f. europaeum TaxID=173218 RepID=A0AAE1IFE9_9HYPO|nr:hypothetical protein Triagg1_4732 [Trichoderma aggressivum f. europaeum]